MLVVGMLTVLGKRGVNRGPNKLVMRCRAVRLAKPS